MADAGLQAAEGIGAARVRRAAECAVEGAEEGIGERDGDRLPCREPGQIGDHGIDEVGEIELARCDETGERGFHGAEGALGRGPGLVEGALAPSPQGAKRHRERLRRASRTGQRCTGFVTPPGGIAEGAVERADPLQRLLHVRPDTERKLEITGHYLISSVAGARSAR